MQQAQTSIQDAQDVNADKYAAATLARARDRLDMAHQAIDHGNGKQAHYLVEEATVLAQLAQAQALQHDSQQSLTQIEDNLKALKQRLQ